MFERYTESARRALFFARYEVSEHGGVALDTDHILLGLIRDPRGLFVRILGMTKVASEDIRKDVESRTASREKVPTSVEIPFTAEAKRALEFAAAEADRIGHSYIGTEHLLLGLLRVEGSVAEGILSARGLRLDDVRNLVVEVTGKHPVSDAPPTAEPASDTFELVRTTRDLVDQLADLAHDWQRAEALTGLIRQRLDELERLLGG
jgi:ATP-dependent Clp protease ATP-binding subunit ClpC